MCQREKPGEINAYYRGTVCRFCSIWCLTRIFAARAKRKQASGVGALSRLSSFKPKMSKAANINGHEIEIKKQIPYSSFPRESTYVSEHYRLNGVAGTKNLTEIDSFKQVADRQTLNFPCLGYHVNEQHLQGAYLDQQQAEQ